MKKQRAPQRERKVTAHIYFPRMFYAHLPTCLKKNKEEKKEDETIFINTEKCPRSKGASEVQRRKILTRAEILQLFFKYKRENLTSNENFKRILTYVNYYEKLFLFYSGFISFFI